MEYSTLAKTDLKISRIGFGTMSLELENPASENLLQQALHGGINYFDTADLYDQGRNETFLGKVFHGKRDQVIIATKGGNKWRPDGSGWDWTPSKNYMMAALEESLRRLRTSYVDLYQLHGGTIDDPIDEIIEAFELLKAAGKIRYYGISSIRPNVIREYVKRSSLVSVMMQYSLLDRRPEEEMLPFLHSEAVAVLARGSIAKGLLVSKPAAPYLNYTAEETDKAARAVKSVSDGVCSPFSTAMHYVLDNPAINSAVVGIRTTEQLKDALAVCDSPSPDPGSRPVLQSTLPANRYTEHR